MKQVFVKKGNVLVGEVPSPGISNDEVLVQVYYSCISAGTELAGIKDSSKSLYRKALEKPKNVKKALKWLKDKGLSNTITRVKEKVDIKSIAGYSASGIVLKVGKNIKDIKIGDKVACTGAGISNHAEFIAVPKNLTAKIPGRLSIRNASTIALGSIALQGIRRCNPALGEFVAIIGLGIIGQLISQMLRLSGCRTIGIDLNKKRIEKAISLGLDSGINPDNVDVNSEMMRITGGYGVDSVIITAASSSSDNIIINQAIEMCRKKGKVIIIGDVGLNIEREGFYRKELDLLISTSCGPGRYDEKYELKGCEYPYAYIRWTENRNMQEYLKLLSENKVRIDNLIEKVYPIEKALKAYDELKSGSSKPLIIILEYSKESLPETKVIINKYKVKGNKIGVGIIGAGNIVREIHLPNLERLSNIYTIIGMCSKTGSNAESTARKYKSVYATTNYRELLSDDSIDMIIISTRHNLHVQIAIEAAKAGKAIFLEKPMALDKEELTDLVAVLEKTKVPFMVGFNRRFSPFILIIKEVIKNRINPMIINYKMNAGFIPKEHWVHTEEGGGRNIGEACHIYDLFNYLTESKFNSVNSSSINPRTEQISSNDNFIATIKYKDGSVCNLIYTSMGSMEVSKEKMEIYFDNKIICLNDYKELNFFGLNKNGTRRSISDKGHYNELKFFGEGIINNNTSYIIPLWQLIQATEISFKVEEQITK